MANQKIKILVLLTVFIDIIGLGIVIPVLPFYVQSYSGSPLTVTALFAVYALCSFFSAPYLGALSDRYGRRPALIASIASTAAGWFIFAAAPSLPFLYLGRIVDGLAAGNLPIAQSALVDLARDDRERTANLGLIGAVFGIGFIIGPFIGGALGNISHSLPFWFVGVLASVNVVLAYFFLPETRNAGQVIHTQKVSLNPFRPVIRAAGDLALRPNYLALFLFGLAVAGSQATFSLYLNRVYGYQELVTGLIFAGMGVVIAVNQVFVMRKFWLKKFKEPTLELVMLVIFALGYLALSLPLFICLVIGLLAITFGQSVLRVVMNSQIVAKTSPAMRGEALGIAASLISLSAGLSPLLAGVLFDWRAFAPFLLGAVFLFAAFMVLYRERKKLAPELSPEEPVISEV
jgi:DHA1 family tetracycline resistance protein-like MFS transporter